MELMKLVTLSPSLSLHRYEKNATHLFCHQNVHVHAHFSPTTYLATK